MKLLFTLLCLGGARLLWAVPDIGFEGTNRESFVFDFGNYELLEDMGMGWSKVPMNRTRHLGRHMSFHAENGMDLHVIIYDNGSRSLIVEFPDRQNRESIMLSPDGSLFERVRTYRRNGPQYLYLSPNQPHPQPLGFLFD